MPAMLNGLRVVSARIVMPYRGLWYADLDVDPDVVATAPTSGPAALVLGAAPGPVASLLGVIDPLAAGSFVATARARVLGGFGGWSKTVTAQHFNQPGLTSTQVLSSVAASVGETVADLSPTPIQDYMLDAGPASRVFGLGMWWVDPTTGLTTVGPRPPAVPDPSLELLSWDPLAKRAEVACDALVLPGTPIVDPRLGEGVVTVRDVEQVFDANGSRATCWCSVNTVSPLLAALGTLVQELGGLAHLKLRRYRVASPGALPGTWQLQAVDRGSLGQAAPAPDMVPATAWTGVPGCSAKLPPSLDVLVARVDGDPTQPILGLYSLEELPLELTLDGSAAVHLAPTAALVDIAGGGHPVAFADLVLQQLAAISTTLASLTGATFATPYVPPVSPTEIGSAKVSTG